MICHGWRRANAGLPDETSAAAEEGTFAHERFANHLLGAEDIAQTCTQEMYEALMPCVEWAGQQAGLSYVEHKVDFGDRFGYADLTGTSDLVFVSDEQIHIADLKYGRGVVEVRENTQLLIYLVGAVHMFGRRPHYSMSILQPRAWHCDGPIRTWTIDDATLAAFEERLEAAIAGSYDLKSPLVPGDHCQHYCKALGRCKAAKNYSLDLFRRTAL
jgi:hypothetical protein